MRSIKIIPGELLKPKHIDIKQRFMGTSFQNSETETIVRNICIIQKKLNPNEWTPFSWEDYKKLVTHSASSSELGVLEALVNGGRPVWNTGAWLNPGYLLKEDDKYVITPKLLYIL